MQSGCSIRDDGKMYQNGFCLRNRKDATKELAEMRSCMRAPVPPQSLVPTIQSSQTSLIALSSKMHASAFAFGSEPLGITKRLRTPCRTQILHTNFPRLLARKHFY